MINDGSNDPQTSVPVTAVFNLMMFLYVHVCVFKTAGCSAVRLRDA